MINGVDGGLIRWNPLGGEMPVTQVLAWARRAARSTVLSVAVVTALAAFSPPPASHSERRTTVHPAAVTVALPARPGAAVLAAGPAPGPGGGGGGGSPAPSPVHHDPSGSSSSSGGGSPAPKPAAKAPDASSSGGSPAGHPAAQHPSNNAGATPAAAPPKPPSGASSPGRSAPVPAAEPPAQVAHPRAPGAAALPAGTAPPEMHRPAPDAAPGAVPPGHRPPLAGTPAAAGPGPRDPALTPIPRRAAPGRQTGPVVGPDGVPRPLRPAAPAVGADPGPLPPHVQTPWTRNVVDLDNSLTPSLPRPPEQLNARHMAMGALVDPAFQANQVAAHPRAAAAATQSRWGSALRGNLGRLGHDYWNDPGTALTQDFQTLSHSANPLLKAGENATGVLGGLARANDVVANYGVAAVGNTIGAGVKTLTHAVERWGPSAVVSQVAGPLAVPVAQHLFPGIVSKAAEDYRRDPLGTAVEDLSAGAMALGGAGAVARAGTAGEAGAGAAEAGAARAPDLELPHPDGAPGVPPLPRASSPDNAPGAPRPTGASSAPGAETANGPSGPRLVGGGYSYPDYAGNPSFRSTAADRDTFRKSYDNYSVRAAEVDKIVAQHPELKGIPEEDLVGIRGYTTNDFYSEMNRGLRERDPNAMKEYDSFARAATSGLNQLPRFAGTTFRGIKTDTISQARSIASGYKPGQTVTEDHFLSTDVDVPFDGQIQLEVQSKSGRDVSSLAEYSHETEVLFPPGMRFRVISNDFKDDIWHIKMTEDD
jgi:hypothetical protein